MNRYLVGGIIVAVLIGMMITMYVCFLRAEVDKESGQLKDRHMRGLIKRLENAYIPPITIGGEAVIYRPKEDNTIRDEIAAEGKVAIPYLIEGLNTEGEAIQSECLHLLARTPSKLGIGSIMDYLQSKLRTPTISDTMIDVLQICLHRMSGYDHPCPPVANKKNDINAMARVWLTWWEKYKDMIVDTENGIGLKNPDDTITPLPIKNWKK